MARYLAAQCPLWVDTVDKVGNVQRTSNNRIHVSRFLNQSCAPDSYPESILLTRLLQNVYQHNRPVSDICLRAGIANKPSSALSSRKRILKLAGNSTLPARAVFTS